MDKKIIIIRDNELDLAKYKAGAEYTSGKVKVLRPVSQNGNVFQRNYWVDPRDVKSTDVVLSGDAAKGSAEGNVELNIQNMYMDDYYKKIKLESTSTSIRANAKKFMQEIFEQLGVEGFNDSVLTDSIDSIKKLSIIEQGLLNPTLDEETKTQLIELKKQFKSHIGIFFENAKKISEIIPHIKTAIANLHKREKIDYPIDAFLPDWLYTNVETRKNKYADIPTFNWNTNKLELKDYADLNPQHYYSAVGSKIENTNKEIYNINVSFLKERNLEYSMRGQNIIAKALESMEEKPVRVRSFNEIYPQMGYSNQEGFILDYIDPQIGYYYDNYQHTNILSCGFQIFMKDSSFRNLFMLDKNYAEHIIGILISEKGE